LFSPLYSGNLRGLETVLGFYSSPTEMEDAIGTFKTLKIAPRKRVSNVEREEDQEPKSLTSIEIDA
jgi:hypothetical protein